MDGHLMKHLFPLSGLPYMCGGYSRSPSDSRHCYSYNPTDDEWSESVTSMSNIRFRPSCAFSSSYGGMVVSGGLYQYIDSVEYTSGG